MSTEVDYKAFAKDLLKLCRKHNVKFSARESFQGIAPADVTKVKDYAFEAFEASPDP